MIFWKEKEMSYIDLRSYMQEVNANYVAPRNLPEMEDDGYTKKEIINLVH